MADANQKGMTIATVAVFLLVGLALGLIIGLHDAQNGRAVTGFAVNVPFDNSDMDSVLQTAETDVTAAQNMCRQKNGRYEEECYRSIAVLKKDVALCLPLSDRQIIKGCYSVVNQKIGEDAAAKKNTALCAGIINWGSTVTEVSNYKENFYDFDDCIEDVAGALGNINLCKMIPGESRRNDCYSELMKTLNDAGACEMLSEDYLKDKCYWAMAVRLNSYKLCDNVNTAIFKYFCLTDLKKCYEISDSEYRERCFNINGIVPDPSEMAKEPEKKKEAEQQPAAEEQQSQEGQDQSTATGAAAGTQPEMSTETPSGTAPNENPEMNSWFTPKSFEGASAGGLFLKAAVVVVLLLVVIGIVRNSKHRV